MVLVYTGNGKGKTTAALGAALRMTGHGRRVLMIQFFKGEWPVVFGELEAAKHLPGIEILQMGKGFVSIMGDKKPIGEHREAAGQALAEARRKITAGEYGLVILDEANVAADIGLIGPDALLQVIEALPMQTHLILTGRNASAAVIERADLVTEMLEVKHPFQKGVQAEKGIDF